MTALDRVNAMNELVARAQDSVRGLTPGRDHNPYYDRLEQIAQGILTEFAGQGDEIQQLVNKLSVGTPNELLLGTTIDIMTRSDAWKAECARRLAQAGAVVGERRAPGPGEVASGPLLAHNLKSHSM